MAATKSTHRFQPPKGTRDFYPAEMAVRRHLEEVWRTVSIRHGFDEIDGPTFEHLELYTVKSGEGIVSELFSFRREGGDVDYALRPEFTPTLARMVAASAASLPRPTKWFCIPAHFRAERPQRGRLREFRQWNVDVIGDETPRADAEVVAVAIDVMRELGLTPEDVRIKFSHRAVITSILRGAGFADDALPAVFDLLDRRDRLTPAELLERARSLGLREPDVVRFERLVAESVAQSGDVRRLLDQLGVSGEEASPLIDLLDELDARDMQPWYEIDLGIVRGLAYYTGAVFEVHEAAGRERAIAGGGRYDQLVEMFGGASTPAVGFAMGDVVIRLVLEDRGLLQPAEAYLPRPDVFVIDVRDGAEGEMNRVVSDLRRGGLHVRHSYRATRNVGKLLGEAGRIRARFAVILDQGLEQGKVGVKNLESGEQTILALADLPAAVAAH